MWQHMLKPELLTLLLLLLMLLSVNSSQSQQASMGTHLRVFDSIFPVVLLPVPIIPMR